MTTAKALRVTLTTDITVPLDATRERIAELMRDALQCWAYEHKLYRYWEKEEVEVEESEIAGYDEEDDEDDEEENE